MSRRAAARRARSRNAAIACSCSAPSSPSDRRSIFLGYSPRMDSRAKQRLTGAVILVSLFVLVVPYLRTGRRDAQQQPPKETTGEAGLRRYTFDVENPRSSVQPAAPPPEVALPAVEQNPAEARAIPGEAAAPAPPPAPPASARSETQASIAVPAASQVDPPPPKPAPAAAAPRSEEH